MNTLTPAFSDREARIESSKTSGARIKASKLRSQGIDVINFASGELDYMPPSSLLSSIELSNHRDSHRYVDTAGLQELRRFVSANIASFVETTYSAEEVIITTGAKHGLFLSVMTLLNEGDEVLLPQPSWGTFKAQIILAGGTPVAVESQGEGFNPTAVELEKCIGQNTKLIVLNSPCNPTGEIYSEHQLREISKLAKEQGLWILFDESYRNLIRSGGEFAHPVTAFPDIRDQVVTVGSFSKSLAITGWRVGYAYGGQEVIRRLKKLQSHTASNANSLARIFHQT